MTAYTTITNGEIDQDSPVTQPLMTSLRDNPIAITEGSAGAPKVAAIAAMSHGGALEAVGTYALLCYPSASTTLTAGTTYAGSNLRYVGFTTTSASSPFASDYVTTGGTPAGTWRAMGTTATGKNPITLFLRVS